MQQIYIRFTAPIKCSVNNYGMSIAATTCVCIEDSVWILVLIMHWHWVHLVRVDSGPTRATPPVDCDEADNGPTNIKLITPQRGLMIIMNGLTYVAHRLSRRQLSCLQQWKINRALINDNEITRSSCDANHPLNINPERTYSKPGSRASVWYRCTTFSFKLSHSIYLLAMLQSSEATGSLPLNYYRRKARKTFFGKFSIWLMRVLFRLLSGLHQFVTGWVMCDRTNDSVIYSAESH